jgi:hypothetical protein
MQGEVFGGHSLLPLSVLPISLSFQARKRSWGQFFVRRAITITVATFGFKKDKVVGRERPRSAAEYAGNTRHCEDAVALPIVVAIEGLSSSLLQRGQILTALLITPNEALERGLPKKMRRSI